MKTHVNLTIEKELIKQVKAYAKKKQTSVSDLVEEYFTKIVRPAQKINIIDMIEGLEAPAIDKNLDLKKAYYEQQSTKHGF
ncbi:DUF6364 family protein [Mucilaginibacter ximonensis]|uniref:DUF6364 family protein n=1 Tax=Mucilaginibacter ximonensis TaxID=538021 RepID=A0ABW5YB16_9SPHI